MRSGNDKDRAREETVNLLRTGRLHAARESGIELCRIDVNDPRSWMILAEIHSHVNEFADAAHCYQKAIDLRPGPPVIHIAHLNRGIALAKLGNMEGAAQHFRETARLQPDLFEAHANLGDALLALQDPAGACSAYQHAARLRPRLPAIYTRLATAMRACGRLNEAEQQAVTALQADPANIHALLEMGKIKAGLNQHGEAIDAFMNALRINSQCKEAWLYIGNIEFHRGNLDAAVDSYRKVLEISPDDEKIRLLTARILASTGDFDKAEAICLTGLELDPANTILMIELGKYLSEQGKTEEAEQWLNKAKNADPASDEVSYLLSALRHGKDTYRARQGHIRKMFDGYADTFDAHLTRKLEYDIPERLWNIYTGHLGQEPGSLDVLDLGCGSGLCGTYFRKVARKLAGVDLSPKMIRAAGAKNCYDSLQIEDIYDYLARTGESFDLVLAADVFIYCGDLSGIFMHCNRILRDQGVFLFSIETVSGADYVLRSSGRYGQSLQYISSLAGKHGFAIVENIPVTIRKEAGQPLPGRIILARK